jgi:hypothetical protein
VKKIRAWIEEVRDQKLVEFHDLDRIIQRCLTKFGHLFPDYKCSKDGSRTVHHFNRPGIPPLSLEKPHGNREFVPRKYARLILDGLEQVANHIEMNIEDDKDADDRDIDDTAKD